MTTATLKYRKQDITVRMHPENSVWDAFQTTTTRDKQGEEKGRGDFQVGEFRIFAENMVVARMIAKRLGA